MMLKEEREAIANGLENFFWIKMDYTIGPEARRELPYQSGLI